MKGKHSINHSETYRINKSQTYNKQNKSKASGKKNTSKKKKGNSLKLGIPFKILTLVYIVITVLFYVSILKLNLLPNTYIIAFTAAEIIFTLIISIGMAKKHKTYKLNISCLIVAVILSAIYIYGINYANATHDFFGSVFTDIEETEDYYIVVRKSSSMEKVEDLEGKDVYFYQLEDDVRKEVGSKAPMTLRAEDNLIQMGTKLINSKVDVLFISSVQYDMLSDEIENFKDNTKIIYTATHKIKKGEETIENEDTQYKIGNGVFNVYISGIDTSGRISNVSRSDANMIATVNTNTHEILLTSIPRDYYVTLHSKKAKDKLTHSGIYGINETVTTVEDLLDIDINYYVRVNFTTVIKVVDTLGGIDVYSDYNVRGRFGYNFTKGINHMNGEQALAFSRERYAYSDGDNQRVKNQQKVIEAIIEKASSSTILTKYTSILKTLDGSFQTNIEQSEISGLVKQQLKDMSTWTIKTNSLTGSGASKSTYSAGSQLLYVMIPDSSSVSSARTKILEFMGETNND